MISPCISCENRNGCITWCNKFLSYVFDESTPKPILTKEEKKMDKFNKYKELKK